MKRFFSATKNKYDLTIVINFYNMRREAARTLLTLSRDFQQHVENISYEVIAVDSGSTEPLDRAMVESYGDDFRYLYYDAKHPSPCMALNAAVDQARSPIVMCLIDGARMVSPGVIAQSLQAARSVEHPFVYTLSMHLGHEPQNDSLLNGYNQEKEDALLTTLDWQQDGYGLFDISCVTNVGRHGFFSPFSESNCFMLTKNDYKRLGGFDERFIEPGGGLANLDFFNRIHEEDNMNPIVLLGEATFHQFHGGVASNAPMKDHPFGKYNAEYHRLHGKNFSSSFRPPKYFGSVTRQSAHLVQRPEYVHDNEEDSV